MSDDVGVIGFKIKGLRIARKMSPPEVAKFLDITPTYLSLIENGKKKPSKKVLDKAAVLFDVSVDSFYTKNELLEKLSVIASESPLNEVIEAFEQIIREKS